MRRVDPDRVEERLAGLAGVAVGDVGRDEPLVAPPDDHPRPVDAGAGGEPGQLAVDRVGDGAAGERDLRARRRPPGRRRAGRAARRRPRSASASASAQHLDRGRASWRSLRRELRPACLRRRGVHVVLVEPAQLLGEQLGQVAALERDRPVGLARRGERRQLAVGAGDPDRRPRRCSSTTSVMPGPVGV